MSTNDETQIKDSSQISDEKRLWIGNLDPRVSDSIYYFTEVVHSPDNLEVTWAHSSAIGDEVEKPKQELNIPALSMGKPEKKTDREFQIQAIEAKLKLMEHNKNNELVINKTVATEVPIISQYQHNKQQPPSSNSRVRSSFKKPDRHHKPYTKHKSRR
ncbi:hypothetical protein Trydic_g12086 [Trypoxylus dichotomus]